MNNDNNRPGVVLYEETSRKHSDVYDFTTTPINSLASPAVYHQQGYPRKIYNGPKSGDAPPSRFLHHTDDEVMMYPDEDSRFAFLRKPTTQILISVVIGIGLGVLMSHLDASSDTSQLISLPGTIFLRILKCFVMPMVFVSVSTGVANMVSLGKVSTIGMRTACYFALFSTLAATLSLAISMLLRNLNGSDEKTPTAATHIYVNFLCDDGKYLVVDSNGTTGCIADVTSSITVFELKDLTNAITPSTSTTTLSEQMSGLLNAMAPSNLVSSFQSGILISVIMFSIAFGAAAIQTSSKENSPLMDVLNQLNKVFFVVISKVIDWSPLAVCSLVAGSLATEDKLSNGILHAGTIILSNFVTVVIFELVFFPLVLWMSIRRNPWPYMRAMIPAVTFAFGSASSLATLPITMRCVESTREVSRGMLHFVVTIGATVHMNGTAMFFPSAIVFLSTTAHTALEIGWLQMIFIVIVSVLSSIGVAPVPNAGLVMIYSIWATIYPFDDIPVTYSYLLAVYWYIDRMNTMCNVLGNAYVARIIAEQVDEAYETAYN